MHRALSYVTTTFRWQDGSAWRAALRAAKSSNSAPAWRPLGIHAGRRAVLLRAGGGILWAEEGTWLEGGDGLPPGGGVVALYRLPLSYGRKAACRIAD